MDFFQTPDDEDVKGGPGSGNFAHAGRPGKVGGSGAGNGADHTAPPTKRQTVQSRVLSICDGDRKVARLAFEQLVRNQPGDARLPWGPWDYERELQFLARDHDDAVKNNGRELWPKQHHYSETPAPYPKINLAQYEAVQGLVGDLAAKRQKQVDKLISPPTKASDILGDLVLDEPHYNADAKSVDEIYTRVGAWCETHLPQATCVKVTQDEANAFVRRNLTGQVPETYLNVMEEVIRQHQAFEVRRAVAGGLITPELAGALRVDDGWRPQGKEWTAMPATLYHAATNVDAILHDQMRSRFELGQNNGLGLGGGEGDTMSFTGDRQIGQNIERALHEAHLVASGQFSVRHMVEAAARGDGADGPWANTLVHFLNPSWAEGHHLQPDYDPFRDGMPQALADVIDEDDGRATMPGWITSEKPAEYQAKKRWDFYVYNFASARGRAPGGFEDPVFFGTDWKGLAKLDPRQFGTVIVKPPRTARGYQMSGLGEWRTVGGENVPVARAERNFDPDASDYIDRVTGRRR